MKRALTVKLQDAGSPLQRYVQLIMQMHPQATCAPFERDKLERFAGQPITLVIETIERKTKGKRKSCG